MSDQSEKATKQAEDLIHKSILKKKWLLHALIVTLLWGIWGALIELPEKAGFPATLGYAVWALTMVPVAIFALKMNNWELDYDLSSIVYGMSAGLMGCGGQLILFQALRWGPAYIVFPVIQLFPIVTIFLSLIFLNEKASKRAWAGIVLALIAIGFLSYQPPSNSVTDGYFWLTLTLFVFLMWGLQAFIMKYASDSAKEGSMKAESVTFYLMVSAIVLIPVSISMTDFSQQINWGISGVYSATLIQSLNAIGFLFFAYAIREGKAIIVTPLMSLAPVVTVILSLIIYTILPHPIILTGMVIALIAIYLLSEE